MEDKHIFKGEFVYSVRIDGTHTTNNHTLVTEKMMEYFTRACIALEHKKDGTPHYQAVAWRSHKLSSTDNTTMRTYFKQKMKYNYNNAVSITSARKVESLAKYCNDKEDKGVLAFGISDLSVLGKWDNQESQKQRLKDQLIQLYKDQPQTETVSIPLLLTLACQVYKDFRPPPFKSLLQMGRSAGYLTDEIFIKEYYPSFSGHPTYLRNPSAPPTSPSHLPHYKIESESETDSEA